MNLEIYTDGSVRPIPHGNVAIGIIILQNQIVIHEIGENLGFAATNQIAELIAVIRALEEAITIGATDVIVYMITNAVQKYYSRKS